MTAADPIIAVAGVRQRDLMAALAHVPTYEVEMDGVPTHCYRLDDLLALLARVAIKDEGQVVR